MGVIWHVVKFSGIFEHARMRRETIRIHNELALPLVTVLDHLRVGRIPTQHSMDLGADHPAWPKLANKVSDFRGYTGKLTQQTLEVRPGYREKRRMMSLLAHSVSTMDIEHT